LASALNLFLIANNVQVSSAWRLIAGAA
jgi:hypothetical protein